MDTSQTYVRLWWDRALLESRLFWTEHRLFDKIGSAFAAIFVTAILALWGYAAMDLTYSLCLLVGTPAILLLVRFARDLLFSPSLLHRDGQQKIAGLEQNVSRLRAILHAPGPLVSPEESRRRTEVAAMLGRFTEVQKIVFRRILTVGAANVGALGMAYGSALTIAESIGLVVRAGNEWDIRPELKSALEYVLTSEGL